MGDSPEHQIFECTAFDCEERQLLLSVLNENINDFKWNISSSNLMENQNKAVKLFIKLVNKIEMETQQDWDEQL